MKPLHSILRCRAGAVALAAGLLAGSVPASAAVIGVLSDGRQAEYLSLLGASSAQARLALAQDGHELITLGSLAMPVINTVEVLWLPLLDVGQTYTAQERANVVQFAVAGGRVVWIGDADVYNSGDNSLLSAFGMSKLPGNLNAALAPASGAAAHPVLSGPHGVVQQVAANTGYGLFTPAAGVVGVFVGQNEQDPPQAGTFAGFLAPDSGFAGSGRLVFLCDSSAFGQYLDIDGADHRALLRNMVKWMVAETGYTPRGLLVDTGNLSGGGTACSAVRLVFDEIVGTGETSVAAAGHGRCGFTGLPAGSVPTGFVGYAFRVSTTAALAAGSGANIAVSYVEAPLAALDIAEADLRLFGYDSATGQSSDLTTALDASSNTIAGRASGVGPFFLGMIVPTPDCNQNGIPDECDVDSADPDGNSTVSADCNANGIPDECEIEANSSAPGGPFFCTADCQPDCNNNGVPDGCDIASGAVADCNNNSVPDGCDIISGESQDCNGDGVPDECQLAGHDCNGNGMPDECESDLLPAITTPPAAQAACAGGEATFTVTAAGSGTLTYQWRRNGVNLNGATEVTLVLSGLTAADEGDYDVRVGNPCGEVVSPAAALAVRTQPIITQQPTAATPCEGTGLVLSVVAEGLGDLAYRWSRGGTPLADDDHLTGSATATLTIQGVTPDHAGEYACTITDLCGSLASLPAMVTVRRNPSITTSPESRFACPGATVAFQVVATGAELTYRWQHDAGGGFADLDNGGGIGGAATATLTLAGVAAGSAGMYRCVVSGACGEPAVSGTATLTLGEVVQVVESPADVAACPGDAVSLTVQATGTSLSYQWQFDSGSGYRVLDESFGVTGSDSPTLNIAASSAAHAGSYRCAIFGSCGAPALSEPAAISVGEPPQIIEQPPAALSACPGGSVTMAVVASGTQRTYQWQFNDGSEYINLADGGGVSGATTTSLTLSSLTAPSTGDYHCVINGGCGGPVVSSATALSVGVPVSIVTQPQALSLCIGQPATFAITAVGSGLAYQWQFNGGAAYESLADGNGVSGVTTATLSIAAVGPLHQGLYLCLVSGACTTPAVTSAAAVLTVSTGACDCNATGTADADDIAAGLSPDCNANGVPDECEIDASSTAPGGPFFCAGDCQPDCNNNGVPDSCDLTSGLAQDCNANGIPDVCDIASGAALDCNGNGIPDVCDIASGASADCNRNGVPDECEPPYVADAGPDFFICAGQTSLPLGGQSVVSGSTPPYTYLWRIVSGPTGGGTLYEPTDERPRFAAALPGAYVVEVSVSDATQPPCVTTDQLTVAVGQLAVSVGEGFSLCVGSTSAPLAAAVDGGVPPYTFAWSIEAGSPDLAAAQFGGNGPEAAHPVFTPTTPGLYTLRLSVQDANVPPCTSSATVTVRARLLEIQPPSDFAMCAGGTSAPLTVGIATMGEPPLTYAWSIESDSPNPALSQFTGSGPASSSPTFTPTSLGTYRLRVVVRDASTPPCEQTAIVQVEVEAMSVEAGEEQRVCAGGGSIRLAPTIAGGVAPLSYTWTIEPGSPSTSPIQFSDPHNCDAAPLFTPLATGSYTLRLTVTDSATPPCTASDSLVVRATAMTVDAGEDFVTPAFRASRRLGAVPVAGGGDQPRQYRWEILSGPSRDAAQLSAVDVEHPTLAPSAVGQYELRVTVTDANGAGCAVSDVVLIEAIASAQTLPVNAEGLVFMMLQFDAAATRAEIRLSEGTPGRQVIGELWEDLSPSTAGLAAPIIGRRLRGSADLTAGAYTVVVVLYYSAAEVGDAERSLRIHRYNTVSARWLRVSEATAEIGPYPLRPERADVGRQGVDVQARCVWAVVNALGDFAAGVPGAGGNSPGETPPPAGSDLPADPDPTSDGDQLPAVTACGVTGPCGAGTLLPLAAMLVVRSLRGERYRPRRAHEPSR